ncbi:MAG TPA: signal peptide peptidase SppA [Pirellulales bacterium]|nr:signal peptide peptidase SppA [Pirellulales bacterium]
MTQEHPSAAPQVVSAVPVVEVPRRRNGLRLVVMLLAVLFFGVAALVVIAGVTAVVTLAETGDSHVEEKYHSLAKDGTDKIAIISVEGTIIDGENVKKQIDHARDDKHVKAVVLRVDSPGGSVTGSDFIYHHLSRLRKDRGIPIVVSMGGLAASGGYYVSMAVGDEKNVIFAEPTTWTGSVGVVIPHFDFSGLAAEYHVSEDSIKSHRLKQMGSMFKPMTEEERKIFQELVNEAFERFKGIVMSGRPKFRDNPKLLDEVATGQVFTTRQALESGLVDKEGFIEDALERALELAKLDPTKTKAVKYKLPFNLFEGLLATSQVHSAQPELQRLLDASTPRAWYVFAWPMATTAPGGGN